MRHARKITTVPVRIGVMTALVLASWCATVRFAAADPPLPADRPTICPTVQCMRVTSTVDNGDGSFDVTFEAFNWYNTTIDAGVGRVLFFPSVFRVKTCGFGSPPFDDPLDPFSKSRQVRVLGAIAPANWTVVQADDNGVEFQADATFEIPDLDLCDPSVIGGCLNGGGPGVSTCGNEQGGFVITLEPLEPLGSVCSWVPNWRQLDASGLDNGDVMNFGSVSWTFGSLTEDYANTPLPLSFFPATDPASCAKAGRKKASKYASTRIKEYSKCLDTIAKGGDCDEVKRDQKILQAKTKLEQAIDDNCSNDQVANVAWCGTTVATLKTCLVAQLDASTTAAITSIYGTPPP